MRRAGKVAATILVLVGVARNTSVAAWVGRSIFQFDGPTRGVVADPSHASNGSFGSSTKLRSKDFYYDFVYYDHHRNDKFILQTPTDRDSENRRRWDQETEMADELSSYRNRRDCRADDCLSSDAGKWLPTHPV